jgi:hypothetical protein
MPATSVVGVQQLQMPAVYTHLPATVWPHRLHVLQGVFSEQELGLLWSLWQVGQAN